jgi:hypothetical protein
MIMVTDPSLIAEAVRHKSLDKTLLEPFGNYGIDQVITSVLPTIATHISVPACM